MEIIKVVSNVADNENEEQFIMTIQQLKFFCFVYFKLKVWKKKYWTQVRHQEKITSPFFLCKIVEGKLRVKKVEITVFLLESQQCVSIKRR